MGRVWFAGLWAIAILAACGSSASPKAHPTTTTRKPRLAPIAAESVVLAKSDLPKKFTRRSDVRAGSKQSQTFWRCIGFDPRGLSQTRSVSSTFTDPDFQSLSSQLVHFASADQAKREFTSLRDKRMEGCYRGFMLQGLSANPRIDSIHDLVTREFRNRPEVIGIDTRYEISTVSDGINDVHRRIYWLLAGPDLLIFEEYALHDDIDVTLENDLFVKLEARLERCAADTACIPGTV